MKEAKKYNRGITLIALIITIIVLLILAIVSIKFAIDGGIIVKAKTSQEQYIIAKEKELLSLSYQDYLMANINGEENYTLQNALDNENANATVIEETEEYWLVKFNETSNQYKLYKSDQRIEKVETGEDSENPDNPEKVTLKVGDYVDYPYEDNYASVKRRETGISFGNDTDYGFYHAEISTKNVGWRVLNIDEDTGKIVLVSATASTPGNSKDGELILKREQVYNNGVELLNRICDAQYTIEGIGKARSINLEDINNAMGVKTSELSYSTINATFSAEYADHDNSYYPARLEEEKGVEIDSVKNENGLSKSEAGKSLYLNNEKITTVNQGSSETNIGLDLGTTYKKFEKNLKVQYTDTWVTEVNENINSITDQTLKEVILGKDETRTYWIATRSISKGSWWGNNIAYFGMLQVINGTRVSSVYNYGSQSDSGNNACDYLYGSGNGQLAGWFRPVIELDTNKTIDTSKTDTDGDGVVQDGSFEQPWKIVNK